MTLEEYLQSLAGYWVKSNSRTKSALGALIAKDGKFFARLDRGGRITTSKFEECLSFFREGENWKDNRIPSSAVELLDRLDNISTEKTAIGGNAHDLTAPSSPQAESGVAA